MITEIRKKIVGNNTYLMWAFIIVVIVSLGAPGLLRQSTSFGTWVLKINGQEVGYTSFIRTVEAQQENARQKSGRRSPINEQELYSQSIDMLIYRELLDQAAAKASLFVSPSYVMQRMQDPRFVIPILAEMRALPAFGWGTGIDMRTLRKSLSSLGLTVEDFENELGKTVSRELIQQIAFIAGYTPKFEQENFYKQTELAKTITVVTFPISQSRAAEKEAGITKHELQAFYDKNSKKYGEPEKRSGTIWEFTPEAFGCVITPEDIEAYYTKHKEALFVEEPAKIRVRRILLENTGTDALKAARALKNELDQNPELFADKARELSRDELSASKGGLLDVFARGVHDKAFDKGAFLLSKDGAISDVITTKDGLELIQRVERFDKVYKPIKKVKDEIYAGLIRKKFDEMFTAESKPFIRSGSVPEFNEFAAAHHATPKEYRAVTRDSSKMASRLFGIKKDALGSFLEDGKGYVALVTAVEPAFVPQLASLESRIQNDIIEQKAVQNLTKTVQLIKQDAVSAGLRTSAKQHKGIITQIDSIKSTDTDRLASYTAQGIPIDKLILLEKIGSIITVVTDNAGYVAQLDAIEKFDPEALHAIKSSLITPLRQERMGITLFGFIASLRRTATIKQNDALLSARGQ